MRNKKEDLGGGDELRGLTAVQEAEAEHRGLDFLTKIVRWSGLVLWTGCFEGCWLLLVVLCPLACVLVG